jgi:hypothetical protein
MIFAAAQYLDCGLHAFFQCGSRPQAFKCFGILIRDYLNTGPGLEDVWRFWRMHQTFERVVDHQTRLSQLARVRPLNGQQSFLPASRIKLLQSH